MKWAVPPAIKVYEALGCLADQRIEIEGDSAKISSSSKGKYYTVTYDETSNAIMVNDNGSYWKGYLGYPGIAFLMKKGKLSFIPSFSEALEGIAWKDLNVKYKNDFTQTLQEVHNLLLLKGVDLSSFMSYIQKVLAEIEALSLSYLGKKQLPPEGY